VRRYIATFFSHYDALTFFNLMRETGIKAELTPVPRKVSASCGTCVAFEHDTVKIFPDCETEAVFIQDGEGYIAVWPRHYPHIRNSTDPSSAPSPNIPTNRSTETQIHTSSAP